MYVTSDGGSNWNQVPGASIPNPLGGEYGYTRQIEVVGNDVWFSTNRGRIYYSSDQGNNWVVYQSPISDFGSAEVNGRLSFSDSQNGIIIDKSNNSITLGNSVTQYFGGSAMWLMHNGSTGYLHNVTGGLYIRNEEANGHVYIQGKSGENSIICNDDGAVELYYDNVKKYETKSYAAAVTCLLYTSPSTRHS